MARRELELITRGPEDTRRLGRRLGQAARAGDVLLLDGPFGAGKTVLVQGFAEGLGVTGHVGSPSFIMVNEHQGRLKLYHIDLYRLEGGLDAEMLDALDEYLRGDGVAVVEWPGPIPPDLRRGATEIRIDPLDETSRRIRVSTSDDHLADAAQSARAGD